MSRSKQFIIGTIVVCAIVVLFIFFLNSPYYRQFKYIFSSAERLQDFVKGFGLWAPLIFFMVQFLQVIIAPIPGNLTGIVGGALFGIINGFLLNGAGIFLGSIVAFFIARVFGQPLVLKLIGKDIFYKYNKVFVGKSFIVLFCIFLFPFFPDDALCFMAGLSNMRVLNFIILILLGRMPGVFVSTLAGAGIISFTLIEWCIIGVLSLVLIWLGIKYSKKIEELISK
ncbi:MAG: TVP38/TMEM64 family protein [Clostridia bacterium]|nr:TVP38/TMEM64 family protein [Clostridia bacterium]